MSDKPEIDVQRRRKGDKPTRQATASTRRESGGSTGGPSLGGTGGSLLGSAGNLLGGGSKGKLGCGGSGTIALSDIDTSAISVAPGDTIRLSVDISGDQIGYVYFFTGLYDSSSNSILIADTNYLESSQTDEQSGVYYPVWPQSDEFRMNFEWEPTLFSITDGTQSTVALFNPMAYGAAVEDAVYAIDGVYTFADSDEQRQARMFFQDGKLFQVFGFQGNDTASAPYEIATSIGDNFTLLHRWMELDTTGQVTGIVQEPGVTLTFGLDPFEWEQVYAPAGNYLVGFLVSDMDGNVVERYTQIQVE